MVVLDYGTLLSIHYYYVLQVFSSSNGDGGGGTDMGLRYKMTDA
jgi:hypothetical protein